MYNTKWKQWKVIRFRHRKKTNEKSKKKEEKLEKHEVDLMCCSRGDHSWWSLFFFVPYTLYVWYSFNEFFSSSQLLPLTCNLTQQHIYLQTKMLLLLIFFFLNHFIRLWNRLTNFSRLWRNLLVYFYLSIVLCAFFVAVISFVIYWKRRTTTHQKIGRMNE